MRSSWTKKISVSSWRPNTQLDISRQTNNGSGGKKVSNNSSKHFTTQTMHFQAEKPTNAQNNEWKKRHITIKETTMLKTCPQKHCARRFTIKFYQTFQEEKIPTLELFHSWFLLGPLSVAGRWLPSPCPHMVSPLLTHTPDVGLFPVS